MKNRFILYSSGMALALLGTVGASIAVGANKPVLPFIGGDSEETPPTRNYMFRSNEPGILLERGSSFSLPLITMPSERLSISLSATSKTTLTIPETIDPDKSLCSISRPSDQDDWEFHVALRLNSVLVAESKVNVFVTCEETPEERLKRNDSTPAGDGKTDYVFVTTGTSLVGYTRCNITCIRVTFRC